MVMLGYFIQVNVCLTVFYMVYVVFFSRMTFFKSNRIFLLGSMVISFVIPRLDFSFAEIDYHLPTESLISTVRYQPLAIKTSEIITSSADSGFSIFTIVYWIGVAFVLGRLFWSIINVIHLRKGAEITSIKETRMVSTDIEQPFSFFNMIFLPKTGASKLVVEHELAHVKLLHWIDLMFVEIMAAMLWYNPIMIFYKRSLKMQHEFEADAYVLKNGAPLEQYLDCLMLHLQTGSSIQPISQFFSPSIKHRIIMMTKIKTSSKRLLLYVILIPVACCLLFAFSTPSFQPMDVTPAKNVKNSLVIIVDAGHGGHDKGSQHVEGVSEKDITLSIAKAVQKAGAEKSIQVILTRMSDEALSLDDRVKMISRYQADAFISLHTNYNAESTTSSGVECFVSEENTKFDESVRLAQIVLQQFRNFGGVGVNGMKKYNFHIIRKNTIPSILLELGFLSNEKDNSFLSDERNHEVISKSIIDAVVQFKK